jgi:hypothetical protein
MSDTGAPQLGGGAGRAASRFVTWALRAAESASSRADLLRDHLAELDQRGATTPEALRDLFAPPGSGPAQVADRLRRAANDLRGRDPDGGSRPGR